MGRKKAADVRVDLPADTDPALPWPVTLAGLYEALQTVVTPAQRAMRAARGSRRSGVSQYYSTVGGIVVDKIKKIDESGLLTALEDDPVERTHLAPALASLMRQVLEATTRAGHLRPCDGHPATTRSKDGQLVPVVCYNCHAPSLWPGSPEREADDVKGEQLKEWMRSALESITFTLDCLRDDEPKNAMTWAKNVGIATDKVVIGVQKYTANRTFERVLRGQFFRLGYFVKDEIPGTVAQWLIAGGFPATENATLMHALVSLALAIEARELRGVEMHENSMAAVSLRLRPPRLAA